MALTRQQTIDIQKALKAKGHKLANNPKNSGIDGIMGVLTIQALMKELGIEQQRPSLDWKPTWDAKLAGVHPDLVKVVRRAAQITDTPFTVIEGVRSDATAYANWGKGRTVAQLKAAGVPTRYANPSAAKVTWLSNPLNTKHRRQKDGYSHAVDLFPAPYQWDDLKPFDAVASAMLKAAKELGIRVRWGADWNENGKPRERGESDSPHFEI